MLNVISLVGTKNNVTLPLDLTVPKIGGVWRDFKKGIEASHRHNLDIPATVRRLNLKPTIRVEAGWFVAYLDDQRYALGKVDADLRPVIRDALQLCREVLQPDAVRRE